MIKLEDAPLIERIDLLAVQHTGGEREVLSDAQAMRLAEIDTEADAIAMLALETINGLRALADNPNLPTAGAWAFSALRIVLSHADAPDEEQVLALVEPEFGEWLTAMMSQVPAQDWSAADLVWHLSMALLTGWPDQPVRLEEGLGDWFLGEADPLYQALLDTAVMRMWGLVS